MHSTLFRYCSLSVALLCAAATLCPAQTRHRLAIPRAGHVGDASAVLHEMRLTATRRTSSAEGEESNRESDKILVVVAGKEKILAVAPDGTVAKSSFVVSDSRSVKNEESTRLFDDGEVLTLFKSHKNKDRKVTIDGEDATDDVRAKLGKMFTRLADCSPESDFLALGFLRTQLASGEKWDVASDKIVAKFSRPTYEFDAAQTSGQIELAGTKKVNGIECLELVFRMSTENVAAQSPAPGQIIKNFSMSQQVRAFLPIDVGLPLHRFSSWRRRTRDNAGLTHPDMDGSVNSRTRRPGRFALRTDRKTSAGCSCR